MACCLEKRKLQSQLRDETRSSLAPLLHAAAVIRPTASYSVLSKSSTHALGRYGYTEFTMLIDTGQNSTVEKEKEENL